ncbi:VOC family protein [Fulvivirgaceae bacterium PWU4]|uniref:VOC family protein n=1 Tax=Chryseosolibacter histidini TaxID=2782349 RepID=A0AAP2GK67_9BACT|nr:VOC family protein [Chryseosolibacter histidini]MBT1699021.1 VOC family protein [Chryseosolibacter histidini]
MNRLLALILLLVISPQLAKAQVKPKVRINHTAIFVVDLKVTKAFYENIIGLDTIPEPFHDGKHAWYSLGGGVAMHVIQGATEKKTYYKNQHTCFSVPSVEAFTAVLKKNNIPFEDVSGKKNTISNRVDGVKQIWLQDPDGYWLEINDAKE